MEDSRKDFILCVSIIPMIRVSCTARKVSVEMECGGFVRGDDSSRENYINDIHSKYLSQNSRNDGQRDIQRRMTTLTYCSHDTEKDTVGCNVGGDWSSWTCQTFKQRLER